MPLSSKDRKKANNNEAHNEANWPCLSEMVKVVVRSARRFSVGRRQDEVMHDGIDSAALGEWVSAL